MDMGLDTNWWPKKLEDKLMPLGELILLCRLTKDFVHKKKKKKIAKWGSHGMCTEQGSKLRMIEVWKY